MIGLELRRILLKPRAWVMLRMARVEIGHDWHFYGLPIIHRHRGSRITIGHRFENRNWFRSNAVGIDHPTFVSTLSRAARIAIGDDVGVSGGVIAARRSIEIGDRTSIGANTLIVDNDFHPRAPANRRYGREAIPTEPVSIGRDVFIGARAIILKGTTIGDRSVVSAGSRVSGDFPADSLISGVPARLIGSLTRDGGLCQASLMGAS